ncbi:hypothetical protein A8F94_09085 [Bacillus sp. FJAT-27225]|uniref:hypothetical protein n=1 Tax=Bacillus sp. FJAT-27225 TaxID=1743144 RepID=UPI00080C2C64|nr:hypothetical protein [Bacillus sp. FJAT-27225]OCA87972.1 hypothetical protein A8F94_09085 [Bacillus sp. FJAT-27225]
MKLKLFTFLICSYLLSFSINLIPSVKHPDSSMNIFNLLATALFLFALLVFIKEGLDSGKAIKGVKVFLLAGFISCLVVYVIKMFEGSMMDSAILDIIVSIQYPLYLLFTTPLFGVNYLFDMGYETFTLWMSVVYALAYIANGDSSTLPETRS